MEGGSVAAVQAAGPRASARLLRLASDARLAALVSAGDEAAFEALYDRHHAAILGFCRHMLSSREEAEDVLQHTFMAAFRQLTGHTRPLEVRPWLFAIARNRCVSLLRMRRAHVPLELADPAVDGLLVTVERREEVRELLADLGRLPEDQRAALLLAELAALDHAGVAAVLGCPREKVKALVFQARSTLAASREARATPCAQIRLELATASGGALRRGPLRRHLRTCDGCRTYKAMIAAQRRLLALALPVIPGAALKATVLGGIGCAHGGAVSAGTASGTLGGVLASSSTAKLAASLALAGAVASGGALAVRHAAPAPPRLAATTSRAWPARAAAGDRLLHATHAHRGRSVSHPQPLGARVVPAARAQPTTASMLAAPRTPSPRAPAGDGSAGTAPAGSATPPTQAGAAVGTSQQPPGHGGVPPGQGGASPGQSGNAPGHGRTPPGQGGTPPGQSGTPPSQSGETPGADNGGTSSGRSGGGSGHDGTPSGQSHAHDRGA